MTPLPPSPDRWTKGVLTLFPSRDGSGHEGTLTLDGVVVYVRRWNKVSGHVAFECQHASDAEMEDIERQLTSRVGG